MINILTNWLVSALVILAVAYILPGVDVASFWVAFVLALVLGFINAVIKPIAFILTLPINILTLGLFSFVINALLVLLADILVPGFEVKNFWWALLFGLILSFIGRFLKNQAKN